MALSPEGDVEQPPSPQHLVLYHGLVLGGLGMCKAFKMSGRFGIALSLLKLTLFSLPLD